MKVSELIEKLTELLEDHGDQDVSIDTWPAEVGSIYPGEFVAE